MFVNSLLDYEGKEVSVIGRIEKIENDIVFLYCGENEVLIKHNGLDGYNTNIVRVKGIVENGVLIEHVVHKINEEFDLELFEKFIKINIKFPKIF